MPEATQQDLAPVVMEIHLPIPAAEAFSRWTEDAIAWWPLSHSIGGERVKEIVFDGRVGGDVVEKWDDGHTCLWARVRAWEPGRRLVLEWHPSGGPWGDEPHTELELVFTDVAGGSTLSLEHRHWDRLAEDGASMRNAYAGGWQFVVGQFTDGLS